MYWSGVQSTGADIKKYFTVGRLAEDRDERHASATYDYRLVVTRLGHLVVSFAGLHCST